MKTEGLWAIVIMLLLTTLVQGFLITNLRMKIQKLEQYHIEEVETDGKNLR